MPPAVGNLSFEQADDFTSRQMGVKLASYSKQPTVDTFTGTRGTGEQFVQEWREYTRHGQRSPLTAEWISFHPTFQKAGETFRGDASAAFSPRKSDFLQQALSGKLMDGPD
jgi:hypothetical protein